MNITRRIPICFVVFFLCLGLFGCSGNESIVGKWDLTVDSDIKTIEFTNDGVYTVTKNDSAVEDGTYKVEGNKLIFTNAYRVEGDKRLNLQVASEDIMTFSINGKILTATTKSGDSMVLTKK